MLIITQLYLSQVFDDLPVSLRPLSCFLSLQWYYVSQVNLLCLILLIFQEPNLLILQLSLLKIDKLDQPDFIRLFNLLVASLLIFLFFLIIISLKVFRILMHDKRVIVKAYHAEVSSREEVLR